MAARSITTKIALEGSDEIRKQLEGLGKSGEDAFAKIKQSGANLNFDQTGSAAQRLGQNLAQAGQAGQQAGQQITQAFTGVSQQIEAANASSSGFGSGFSIAAAGIVAAVATITAAVGTAISSMVSAAAESNAKLQEAAEKAGLTASAYEDMANRIETAGGNVESTVSVLDKLGDAAKKALKDMSDAAKGAGDAGGGFSKLAGDAGGATPIVERLGDQLSKTFSIINADGSKSEITVFSAITDGAGKAVPAASGLAKILQDLGIKLRDFAPADTAERLAMMQRAFQQIKDPMEQARIAAELLRNGWRKLLDVLQQTPEAAAEADAALTASGRKLSDEARKNLSDYTAAMEEFHKALTATRELIGSIFAPGATARAKWLTELIDEGRNWLTELAKIKAAQLDTFFNDRGGKAFIVELLEKARGLASDFGAVITSLVLPAIRLLQAGFEAAAAKINELFGTEISGNFLAIAAAIGVVTGAFGLIGAVLSPIGAVIVGVIGLILRFKTAFLDAGLGAKAFWEDLVALASRAFAAIRAELPAVMEALRALFKGDFAGAWEQFGAIGERAWASIRAAILDAKGSLGDFFTTISTGFSFVMSVLGVFASTINAVFGTSLTAGALAFYIVLAQLGGVFSTVIPAVAALLSIFGKLGAAWLIIGAAAVILYRKMDDLRAVGALISDAFSKLASGDLSGALGKIGEAFSQLWESIKKESATTWVILGAGALLFAQKLLGLFGLSLATGIFSPLATAGTALWPVIVAAARVAATAIALLFTPGGLIALAIIGLGAVAVIFWDDFKAAGSKAVSSIGSLLDSLGARLSELFNNLANPPNPQPLGQQAGQEIAGATPPDPSAWDNFWAAVKQGAADAWQGVSQFASDAWQTISQMASDAASTLWEGISGGAATAWNAVTQAATTTWQTIQQLGTSAWQTIEQTATAVWQSIQATATSVWESIVGAISGTAEGLFAPIAEAATTAFQSILDAGEKVAEGLKSFFQGVADFITAAMNTVKGVVDSILAAVMGAINAVLAILARLGSAGGGKGSSSGSENGPGGADSNGLPTAGAFASGGFIRGPGSGTSDSILARLSNGEFVIRAAAVRKFGPAFFAALNGLKMPKFATGGLVQAMAMPALNVQLPAFATGGPVNTRGHVVSFPLDIGGQQYDLQGHPDTVAALQRHSTLRQISATNKRAPGWNR